MNNFNFSQIPKKYIVTAVAVILAIIIISIIAITAQNQSTQFTKLTITNETELSEVPAETVSSFKETLYNSLQQTFQLVDSIDISDVEGRADTITISESHNEITTYTATFLIDIASLQQTYQISLYWADGDQNPFSQTVQISCPDSSQLKFADSQCLVLNKNGA